MGKYKLDVVPNRGPVSYEYAIIDFTKDNKIIDKPYLNNSGEVIFKNSNDLPNRVTEKFVELIYHFSSLNNF